MTGIAWNGLADERKKTTVSGSPADAMTSPVASTATTTP
jgi:hypothetical protein